MNQNGNWGFKILHALNNPVHPIHAFYQCKNNYCIISFNQECQKYNYIKF